MSIRFGSARVAVERLHFRVNIRMAGTHEVVPLGFRKGAANGGSDCFRPLIWGHPVDYRHLSWSDVRFRGKAL